MRSDLIQVVALCSHGNMFLREPNVEAPELFCERGPFATVSEVLFERPSSGVYSSAVRAEAVAPWLRRLKAEGANTMTPLLTPLGPTKASTPEGDWGVLVDSNRGLELWKPVWKSRLQGYNDPRPHRVVYTARKFNRWNMARTPTDEVASDKLFAAVESLESEMEARESPLAISMAVCRQMHGQMGAEGGLVREVFPSITPESSLTLAASALRIYRVLTSPVWTHNRAGGFSEGELTVFSAVKQALTVASCLQDLQMVSLRAPRDLV